MLIYMCQKGSVFIGINIYFGLQRIIDDLKIKAKYSRKGDF